MNLRDETTRFPAFLKVLASACAITVFSAAPAMADQALIEKFASYWTGAFSTERQVRADFELGEPDYPESVRGVRDMRVYRVDAPAIGDVVLFLEEFKAERPDLANRQRVMTFKWHAGSQEIEVEQLFLSGQPTYDAPPVTPQSVTSMKKADFGTHSGCNLFIKWQADRQRFKGGMRPGKCTYTHEVSGPVYADYDMILDPQRVWYRDRSILVPDGGVRGEIDGFSWLRFDRLSDAPKLANGDRISLKQLMRRIPGRLHPIEVWEGEFRRVDANGDLIELAPSKIISRLMPDGEAYDFYQTNILYPGTDKEQRIESYGKWDVDRLTWSNSRLDGYSKSIVDDTTGMVHSYFLMKFKDGSDLVVSEIISKTADGKTRMRATQYLKGGDVIRRTLIQERLTGSSEPDGAR